jgi:DpnII restriction endonuclease
MKFTPVTLDGLIGEISALASNAVDDVARATIERLPAIVDRLRSLGRTPDVSDLTRLLEDEPISLDVFRLFMAEGQETLAHKLSDSLGRRIRWPDLRRLILPNAGDLANAFIHLGLPGEIETQLGRRWSVEDVLLERYRLGRGRAIAGQSRGRAFEDAVEGILKEVGIPFEPRVTFTGKKGQTAKCDFAIPNRQHPLIVLEVKGFEATGSKLTDFLGDVAKIAEAKDFHVYFFVVTDGRGWFNRKSDLKKIVQLHHDGLIEMIYTRKRLPQLAQDVTRIWTTER